MKASHRSGARGFADKAPAVDRFAFSGEMSVSSVMTDADFAEHMRALLQEKGDHWAWARIMAQGAGWAELRGQMGRDLLTIIAFDLPYARFLEYRIRVEYDLSQRPVPVHITGYVRPTVQFGLALAVAMLAVFVFLTGLFIAGFLLAIFDAERSVTQRYLRRIFHAETPADTSRSRNRSRDMKARQRLIQDALNAQPPWLR